VLGTGDVREMMSRVELRPTLAARRRRRHRRARRRPGLESGLARLEFGGGALEIPDVEALPGEQVRIRVRARDVSIALVRPAGLSIRNVLAGTVVELAGDEGSSLDVRLDLHGTPLLARITRKSASELGLRPGLPVFALIKAVSIDRRSVGYA
jgi:molybdate transport system ATP-binding protein